MGRVCPFIRAFLYCDCYFTSFLTLHHCVLCMTLTNFPPPIQCQNYSCCGLHLRDLHALVRHFEEAHVVVHGAMSPIGSNFGMCYEVI